MTKYIIYKKNRKKSGGINRKEYLRDSGKSVNEIIKRHKNAGSFISGNYVAFRILKNGKIAKKGKPFIH